MDDALRWWRSQDDLEEWFGRAIRQGFDEMYDGQGRFR